MKHVTIAFAAVASLVVAAGCIHVSTESEIKPIHITMDVNLKVDRELDRQFANERQGRMGGDYRQMMELLNRKVAGVDNLAMLVARDGATEQDKQFIADSNARRLQRFQSVARDTGSTPAAVQKRHAARMRTGLAAGVWYQDDAGNWSQK